jgi:arginine/lysine/ornithine decarboxylase
MGKLVIQVKSITYTGQDLYNELLSKYHIQLEMAARDYVIAMTSLNDTKDGFDRLYEALFNIDRDIRIKEGYGQAEGLMHIKPLEELGGASILEKPAVTCMDIRAAINSEKEEVEFSSSSGRIAAEYVYLYPPGVPVIVPGQMIEKVVIDYLQDCKAKGLQVQGQEDDELINIVVIKENWKEFSYGKNILPDGEKLIGEGYHV